jgi:hypothetical protein
LGCVTQPESHKAAQATATYKKGLMAFVSYPSSLCPSVPEFGKPLSPSAVLILGTNGRRKIAAALTAKRFTTKTGAAWSPHGGGQHTPSRKDRSPDCRVVGYKTLRNGGPHQ